MTVAASRELPKRANMSRYGVFVPTYTCSLHTHTHTYFPVFTDYDGFTEAASRDRSNRVNTSRYGVVLPTYTCSLYIYIYIYIYTHRSLKITMASRKLLAESFQNELTRQELASLYIHVAYAHTLICLYRLRWLHGSC
jgi:hypothetical protein